MKPFHSSHVGFKGQRHYGDSKIVDDGVTVNAKVFPSNLLTWILWPLCRTTINVVVEWDER